MLTVAAAAVWAFLKGIPWKVWLALIAFAVAVFVFWSYGESRYAAGERFKQGQWDRANTVAAALARRTEDGWRAGVAKYATDETRRRLEREKQFAAAVDGLRAGALRVRPRLQCPGRPAASSGSGPGHDDPAPRPGDAFGLSESDAEFLLRIGAEADAVSGRLAQCQHYVRTVTGG